LLDSLLQEIYLKNTNFENPREECSVLCFCHEQSLISIHETNRLLTPSRLLVEF